MNKTPILITPGLLRRMPLPDHDAGGDDARGKDKRGQTLAVGGSAEVPGGILLAATGALRAGAGKLQIAAPQSVAVPLAVAMPEARVVGLPELPSGGPNPASSSRVFDLSDAARAVLYGPGMTDETAVVQLLLPVLRRLTDTGVVLDAAALACLSEAPDALRTLGGNAVLTPHPVEMALMLGIENDAVTADPPGIVLEAASKLGATVVLKGAETFIATPDGTLYVNRAGNIGLAVSGSGDTLAGIITGLMARGASAEQAAVWGVSLHGRAGDVLARRVGPLGFLAREILPEIPPLMRALQKPPKRRG